MFESMERVFFLNFIYHTHDKYVFCYTENLKIEKVGIFILVCYTNIN